MMEDKKICIAGGRGLVGTSLVKRLENKGYHYCASADRNIDLRSYETVKEYFQLERPDCVILVAAKHGGIGEYSSRPVEYFRDNLLICSSVITAAFDAGVHKLINIGASCVYGSEPDAVYREEDYDREAVQKSTEPYGLAKLAGMKLCEYYNQQYGTDYISLLPVNLYGDAEGYHLDFSSVVPSMLQRFHNAKMNSVRSVEIWGDGENTREFLFVDDFIDAMELMIKKDIFEFQRYNVCGSENITINELARIIARVVGYTGEIVHDLSKPGGSSRGTLDASRLRAMGWVPKTSLETGVRLLYKNYLNSLNS